MELDLYLFSIMNGIVGKWVWLDTIGIFFARYFEYFLLAFLLILLARNFRKYWRMTAEAFVAAVFVRFVLVEIIRRVFFRPRPFVYNQINLLVSHSANEPSFPSGHASFYFALSTIIYGYNKRLGILFYISSFLIVVSRIFVGIHWPSDIVAGAILGIAMGLILNKLFKRIF